MAARICCEVGGRVTTNAFVRDIHVEVMAGEDWKLSSTQLAVDTTLVSHGDGSARRRAADENWVPLAAARRTETRHPELVGPRARARLVVLGVEVGGRWSGRKPAIRELVGQSESQVRGLIVATHG